MDKQSQTESDGKQAIQIDDPGADDDYFVHYTDQNMRLIAVSSRQSVPQEQTAKASVYLNAEPA